MQISSHPRSKHSHRRCAIVRLVWLLTLFCLNSAAGAQYRFRVWTAEDGLPQNIVRGISQTPDGYLWIATLDGLARFDGVQFFVFNKSNTPGITSNRFEGMYPAPNGDLWLPTERGGLLRYHHGIFHTYDVHTLGITGNAAGDIWIDQGGAIAKWDEASGRFIDATPSNLKLKYRILHWQNDGFWGADGDGLHCFVRGHFVTYPLPRWLKSDTIGVVAVDQRGGAWLETTDGSHLHIAPNGVPGPLLSPDAPAMDSFVDVRGHAWNISVGHHLSRSIQVPPSGGITEISFSHLFEDQEKNLWFASEGQGLYQLQKQSIQVISKEQGLGARNVYPVFQDRSGAVWIGAWPSGLSRFNGRSFTNYTVADGLPNGLVTALAQDREGRIWVGTHGGVSLLAGKRFRNPPGPSLPDGALVQAIYQDREGTMWFGTSDGLASYRDGHTQFFNAQNGPTVNDVRTIIEDPRGGLWIGGYGGLTRLHEGHFTHWTEHDGLPSNTIRSLYEDNDGVLWIGTYDGGLGRFKDGRFTRYTEREGLFNNGVFQILEDAHGELWISCNRGIYRVNKQELNQYAAGTRSTITSVAYGKADGLLNVECNGGVWPAGTKTRDGKLWFPTQDGVAIIDPNDLRHNAEPPPVVIESLTANRVPVSLSGPLRIPPGTENLEIQYTGLSFINSEQIRFKYKLEGLDSMWVDAGSRRTAYYSAVPPGRYVFHVIAGNSDGIWNMEGKSLALTVLAPFYRTWWFDALALIVCATLIYVAWHRRVTQLQHAQMVQQIFSQQLIASQENERKRIAAELHDSIGQRLVVINNLALFFLRSHSSILSNGEDTNSIQEISAEATSAIEEAREISYNLRPFQLDRLGLTKAVEGIVRSVSGASGMMVSSQIENIDNLFPEELRINFYRIVQESLNNVMKHAAATEVTIRIQRNEEYVVLSIKDNGCGFTLNTNLHQPEAGGFGLTGMAERARLLGGSFEVRPVPGRGTTLIVNIPVSGDKRG